MNIRSSAKAIILQNGSVLLMKNQIDEECFYLFPGGGMEHGETLSSALIRECQEETGSNVEVGELLHVREYIGKNHEHAKDDSHIHQIEYYFVCSLLSESQINQASNPDSYQTGVEWVPILDIMNFTIYPKDIRPFIISYSEGRQSPVYIGDMN